MKGKGVVDNLFILRRIMNHANYLGKELWLTFYDTEKCFDSLWLEDCMNSLWDLGVKDDVLCLIYLMNMKATVTIKTSFGDIDPLFLSNFVKQGTVLGPVLNNCSLNKLSTDSIGYNFGFVQIKSMEFVDDLKIQIGTNNQPKQVMPYYRQFRMKSGWLSLLRNVNYWKLIPRMIHA